MAQKKAGIYPSADSYMSPIAGLASVTLMLLGKTGSGKSSLGNAILSLSGDDSFKVTDGFCSTPVYTAVAKEARVHDRLVKVVDTPGLMDTSPDCENMALEGICHAISYCSEGVDAFLIVLRLDVRLTDEEWKTVDKLEELFGEQFWKHAIVVFTHGDCIGNDNEKFEKRIEEAKAQLPQMEKLLSKLKTKRILVDARQVHQENIVAKQILNLLREVDVTLTSDGKKKKYTNDIFAAVRASLCTKEMQDHLKKLEAARLEIETLKANNAQPREDHLTQLDAARQEIETLKAMRGEDQQRLEILQDIVAEVLFWSECYRKKVAEKVAESIKKNRQRCTLL